MCKIIIVSVCTISWFILMMYVINKCQKKDIDKKGFLVKKKGDEYQLLHWKKKDGAREVIDTFGKEEEAWKAGIRVEAKESGFS